MVQVVTQDLYTALQPPRGVPVLVQGQHVQTGLGLRLELLELNRKEECFHKPFCSCLVTDLKVRTITQNIHKYKKHPLHVCDNFSS